MAMLSHRALSILDHALRGDPGGLSFLEQTTTIYVLDAATTPGHPATYGWWNFLNDALNEVERYESEINGSRIESNPSIDAHVRLLATIARRVARRPPQSDRRLVGTCLANASMSHMSLFANTDMAQSLLASNYELRERNMGRVAAIVFDFSFHNQRLTNGASYHNHHNGTSDMMCQSQDNHHRRSVFADPVVMEQLCGVLAANAVSSGPAAVRHLVSDWILPSIESLPTFAAVAIIYNIAVEAMGRCSPVGTKNVMQSLVMPVFKRALGPILVDSLRESDETHRGSEHGVAALALSSFDVWCKANSIGAVELRNIFSSTNENVNILEAIADALYSNSEKTIDAVSDLIETLLRYDAKGAKVAQGMSIAESVMSDLMPVGFVNELLVAQNVTGEVEKSRISVLSELVSAVGLQRFRFAERQAKGDIAVCRCLVRTAALVLLESESLIHGGILQASPDGLLELLLKAASHSSVPISSIGIEALTVFTPSNSELSTRLLPCLQGKAIIPINSLEVVNGRQDDYIEFRDCVLTHALVACYTGCVSFYLESCRSAIEEFCKATSSPHIPYQLEAALYCMIAVSEKASKAPNKEVLCGQLEKIVSVLKMNSSARSHPIVKSQLYRFVNKYSKCFSACQETNTFNLASDLVVSSLNHDLEHCEESKSIPAFSDATTTLKQLICSAPPEYNSSLASATLESAWRISCSQYHFISIEDREVLCSGLISVIFTTGHDSWCTSLESLAQPILSCLDTVTSQLDCIWSKTAEENDVVDQLLTRLSHEIRVLATILKFFVEEGESKCITIRKENRAAVVARFRNPVVSLLRTCWPGLTHIVKNYSYIDVIATSIGQVLSNCLSVYGADDELPLLLEAAGLVELSLSVAGKSQSDSSLLLSLSFMQKFLSCHGSKIELSSNIIASHSTMRNMARKLLLMSYEGVRSDVTQDIASPMFDTLSACAKHCPLFFIGLSRDAQLSDIINSSIETASVTLKSNEVDTALSSINFLHQLISSLTSISFDEVGDDQVKGITHVIENVKHSIQKVVLLTAVTSVCVGLSLPDVVEPLTKLIEQIMLFSLWSDIESSVSTAIDCVQFHLGDEAKSVIMDAFRRRSQRQSTGNFGNMIVDAWKLHQIDDTGNIACGEAVHEFVQKYK